MCEHHTTIGVDKVVDRRPPPMISPRQPHAQLAAPAPDLTSSRAALTTLLRELSEWEKRLPAGNGPSKKIARQKFATEGVGRVARALELEIAQPEIKFRDIPAIALRVRGKLEEIFGKIIPAECPSFLLNRSTSA